MMNNILIYFNLNYINMNGKLSSTGLIDINANEITTDNINIYSNLTLSGSSNLNDLTVNNITTLLSSLNVSGTTTINNNTTLLSSLNVSGITNLENETNINASLYVSGVNVFETLNAFDTVLSTLNLFRSDNEEALVSYNTNTGSTEIHSYGGEIVFDTTQDLSLTKIDSDGRLNVYHEYNALMPAHPTGYWIVHDEIEYLLKQDILNTAESILQQAEMVRVAGIATGTAATVAALILVLGVGSIISALLGGGGDGGGVEYTDFNSKITMLELSLNSLSAATTLAIDNLHNTTTSILGYINGNTSFSTLNTNALNVSGFTTLNNATIISSLNVSGFTTLNNATILSNLNVSGFALLNNATILSNLNVSGLTTLFNNTSIYGTLNVSGFTTLNNNATLTSNLNVSGFTTLNNTTFISSLNVSGFTTLNNNVSIFGILNVSNTSYLKDVNIRGNLNIDGTTTIIDTIYSITTINSLSVSGPSLYYSKVTLLSELNVSGFTTLSNNTTILSNLNVSGISVFNNRVGVLNTNPSLSLDIGSTNTNHNIGRAILNAGSIHAADKIDSLSIGRWEGSNTSDMQFTGIKYNVTTGANAGESYNNHSNMSFWTWGNNISNTREVMRLTSRGRLGIGKTNPNELLDVNGVIELSQYLKLSGTNAPGILFSSYGNNNIGVASAGGNFSSSASVGDMVIRTPNKLHLLNGVGASALTIHTNNSVGIGTTIPQAKLEVNGTTLLNSNVTIASTLNVSGYTTISANLNVSGNSFLNSQVCIGTISTLSRLNVGSNYSMGLSDGLCLNASTQLNQYNLNVYANLQAPLKVGYKFTVNNNGSLKDALTIGYNGLIGIGTSNPTSLLDIPTVYDFDYANDLLNFRNTLGYGIYATSIGINGHGNTLDFLSTDYNNGIVTTRNILNIKPDGNVNMESLKVSGKVVFGVEFTPVSDIVFSVHENIFIRKGLQLAQNNYIGDTITLEAVGRSASSSMMIDNNIILNSAVGFTRITSKSLDFTGNDGFQLWAGTTTASTLSSDGNTMLLNSPLTTVSNNLNVGGVLSVSGKVQGYIASRLPIYFTTNRTVTINSINFSAYDINLNLYTRFLTLDGRKIRQFRLRSWHASGNFENVDSNYMALSYEIFMSDLNGLNILSYTRPYNNSNLTVSIYNKVIPLFYRNTFDIITYLSPVDTYGSSVKVYCVFEDLL